mmetsp:Transcript_8429/g.13982  ORF Transcript_8429/g.13982 Transcript_8429/m.13982 type:complete len:275 (-) Transcript_8429:456-1280(-)
MSSFSEPTYVRQADFDHVVKEICGEGASVEEAVVEAKETFLESSMDLSALYLYENEVEMAEKEAIEKNMRILEETAKGSDSIVNATFAIQGLKQTMMQQQPPQSPKVLTGTINLVQSRGLIRTLFKILRQCCGSDDDDDDEDEDEDDDEDENKILMKTAVMGCILMLLRFGTGSTASSVRFRDFSKEINLATNTAADGGDTSDIDMLSHLLDEDSGEPRVLVPLLDLLLILCSNEENRAQFSQVGLAALLDLAMKMNKKTPAIQEKATSLMAWL